MVPPPVTLAVGKGLVVIVATSIATPTQFTSETFETV